MGETEPRYVATFRPGTPEMVIVAVLTVLGAAFVVGLTAIGREVACGETSSDCGDEWLALLIVAVAGLVSALGMLVESGRMRGHPWRWFFATALVYAVWGLFLLSWG